MNTTNGEMRNDSVFRSARLMGSMSKNVEKIFHQSVEKFHENVPSSSIPSSNRSRFFQHGDLFVAWSSFAPHSFLLKLHYTTY